MLGRRQTLFAATAAAAALTPTANPRVRLQTAQGAISIDLYARQAPLSCQDFLAYVNDGAYDGGRFFRVVRADNDHGTPHIDVVQGGVRAGAPIRRPIAHETTSMTRLRHVDGTISLTRDKPGSGSGSEFFICVGPQPALDFGGRRNPDGQGFAAFGQVTAGMEVVRLIWGMGTRVGSDDAYTAGQMLGSPVVISRAWQVG